MLSRIEPVFILTRREVHDQLRDWRVVFPVVVLTLIFPWLMRLMAAQVMQFVEQYGTGIIGERVIPFLMMMVGFFPITISLVIALESFVGEKERRSLEPLLSSPLVDWQIYLGKLLAALILPLATSCMGISVYLWSIWRELGWTPPGEFLAQVFVLTVVQALVMVSGAIVISSQTTSVRAANLLASFIILPMALLIQAESIAMFWGYNSVLWGLAAALLVVAFLLVRMGISHFSREELLGRELDTLNFRWIWIVFKNAFVGQATNTRGWFRLEIPLAFRRLALPLSIMIPVLSSSALVGLYISQTNPLPIGEFNREELFQSFATTLENGGMIYGGSPHLVWLHNLRAMTLATLLGIFTFGSLGVLILMIPLLLSGYLTGLAAAAGFPPALFLAAFLIPHGLLEIPAIFICGAAILRLGATLAAPTPGKTIGEAWLSALADWLKVMLVAVVPLLLGAAALEVWVTPRLALAILGN
jgi:uncharacterized membrane protein SpoIIM required for sporulation/ABC-type transport system involved in multi-copper enzyme maturation permease subunit